MSAIIHVCYREISTQQKSVIYQQSINIQKIRSAIYTRSLILFTYKLKKGLCKAKYYQYKCYEVICVNWFLMKIIINLKDWQ